MTERTVDVAVAPEHAAIAGDPERRARFQELTSRWSRELFEDLGAPCAVRIALRSAPEPLRFARALELAVDGAPIRQPAPSAGPAQADDRELARRAVAALFGERARFDARPPERRDGPAAVEISSPTGEPPETFEPLFEELCDGLYAERGLVAARPSHRRDDSLLENELRVAVQGVRSPPLLLGAQANPDPGAAMAAAVADHLRRRGGDLATPWLIRLQLGILGAAHGELIDRAASLPVAAVARALAEEGVSIRDLRTIVEGLLAVRGEIPDGAHALFVANPVCGTLTPPPPDGALSAARVALRYEIARALVGDEPKLRLLLLSPALEDAFAGAGPAVERDALVAAIRAHPDARGVMTVVQARRRLRDHLAIELPDLSVLSQLELAQDLPTEYLAMISI